MSEQILNISPMIVWVVAMSQLLTFGLTLWNLLASGSRANARTLEGHSETLHGLEARMSALEMSMKGMPGREDLHALSLSMADMRGDMREMRAAVQGQAAMMSRVEAVVSRQEDHLLRTGKS